MLKPECLNPKDVLAHLKSLGYHDITPMQLKEFIHDLKKLIKYDQKQMLQVCEVLKSDEVQNSESGCCCPECDNSDKLSSNGSYCESSASSSSSSSSSSTSATYDQLNNESSKRSGRNTADTDYSQKAHTSFIRPWNLQGCKDLSARGKKNLDPVRLYHQYKEFWKSNNIPGESKHLELRWVIRNKMLGQEPNPRVCI